MTLPKPILRACGAVYFPALTLCLRVHTAWSRLSPGARTALKWVAALAGFALFFLLAGCHAAPAQIRLSSTAAIHAPLDAATTSADAANKSNAKAIQMVAAAVKTGLPAGSKQATDLLTTTQATATSLANVTLELARAKLALVAKDQDDAAKQAKIDRLAQDDADKTASHKKADASWWHLFWTIVIETLAWIVSVSLMGAALQSALRKIEAFAAKEVVAAGETVIHAAEAIPKVAAVAAIL